MEGAVAAILFIIFLYVGQAARGFVSRPIPQVIWSILLIWSWVRGAPWFYTFVQKTGGEQTIALAVIAFTGIVAGYQLYQLWRPLTRRWLRIRRR
jgi:hypothetical protein